MSALIFFRVSSSWSTPAPVGAVLAPLAGHGSSAAAPPPTDTVVDEDAAMQEPYRGVDRIAQGTIAVMLLGEAGVGKEVIAVAIHRRSPRSEAPTGQEPCGRVLEYIASNTR